MIVKPPVSALRSASVTQIGQTMDNRDRWVFEDRAWDFRSGYPDTEWAAALVGATFRRGPGLAGPSECGPPALPGADPGRAGGLGGAE
jgi:hypothetical protein